MTQTDTILVVDDDPAVRLLAARILRRQGYRVLEACDGSEALRIAHEFEGNIDLVVSDIIMPTMRGDELASRMRICFPFTKVLLISSTPDSVRSEYSDMKRGVSFLPKPFGPDALANKVRELIGIDPMPAAMAHPAEVAS